MKITKEILKQIIKEEISATMKEDSIHEDTGAIMGKDAWEDAYREAAKATVDLQQIVPPVANDVAQPILLAIRQARMKLEEAGELYMKYTGKTN